MPHQNGASSAIVIHVPVFTANIANTSNWQDVLARPVDVEPTDYEHHARDDDDRVSNGRTAESQTSPSFTHAARCPLLLLTTFCGFPLRLAEVRQARESQSNNAGASSWVKVHARP